MASTKSAKENKTQKTRKSPHALIQAIAKDQKREDCQAIMAMLEDVSGWPPETWGSMIGFGDYHYKYDSGREGDYFRVGFAPRAQNIVIYIMPGFSQHEELMGKLGKFKTGKSCLYIRQLEDIDMKILRRLVKHSLTYMKKKYG